MVKIKTSQKQKKSLENIQKRKIKKGVVLIPYSPHKEITDEDFIGKALLECLKNNDPEGVMEVISVYLNAIEKTSFAKEANVPKSTLYYGLKGKNPTIKTLAKIIHATTLQSTTKR